MKNVVIAVILWLFFAAIFFFILYGVIMWAMNDSKLAQDVRQIRLILEKRAELDGIDVITDELSDRPYEVLACPECGYGCSVDDIYCSSCKTKLQNEPQL
ncbi:hypothetical protein [Paenibacillus protaetiae]|uniref:Uncharacterized protein n=1 Tax=Paenibacillus protaetiae TaxID=2509456 RepID=A0A4P6F3U5_9BACL|nr:hypothetical protein [Paenibacillus protaetiae]QAY65058.1 hypothetical protein ET464_00310 [Paenibacillus protaetiae]